MLTVALHAGTPSPQSLSLLAVVGAAAAGAAVLLGLAIGAFVRRGSRSYILIVGAFAALFGRSAVAAVTAAGGVTPAQHHFLEHGLDVVLVALVTAAVYHARTIREAPA